jgi:hypothetical protein
MPLRYQWRLNGNDLLNQTNATLTLTNVGLANEGNYDVRVADSEGFAISDPAKLTILINPVFVRVPQSVTVNAGETITLTAEITNTATLPVTWDWRRTPPGGGTATIIASFTTESRSNSLVIPNAHPTNAGNYQVVAKNPGNPAPGAISTPAATVTVISPPVITTQPVGRLAVSGTTVTLAVTATGTLPLTYRWYKDTEILTNRTTATFNFVLNATNEGNYKVVITNSYGTVTSDVAQVYIDSDRNGVADKLEGARLTALGLDSTGFSFLVTATFPMTNVVEFADAIGGPWNPLKTIEGTNQVVLDDTRTNTTARFYRLKRQP